MKKHFKKILLCFVLFALFMVPSNIFAASEGDEITLRGNVIGVYDSQGNINYVNQSDAHLNGNALVYLLSNDNKKTIILPKEKVSIDQSLFIGNNTTIIATGATVYQTDYRKLMIGNRNDKTSYASLSNVLIKGGTWEVARNNECVKALSTFRFSHANNIKVVNCNIKTNRISHGVSFIACKNSTIDGCTIIATGKALKTSEEAVQIDLATKATAPALYTEGGSSFVAGQTCYGITIKNSTIKGSRGICANKTTTQKNKYINKFHRKVTLSNNNVVGYRKEAVVLFNTVGVKMNNNTMTTYNKSKTSTSAVGAQMVIVGKNKISRKYTNYITKNTAKGGYAGFRIYSTKKNKCKFGKTTITYNKLYARKSKKNAKSIRYCSKTVQKGNKLYKSK